MSNDETRAELERLRADLEALTAAREEKPAGPAEQSRTEAVEAEVTIADGPEISDEQRSQLEELGDLLQQEIRDLPTITCLAVFSLGILMGRMMR
jgi:hypothetical protein